MRTARILGLGPSTYHVMSRIVDRRYLLKDLEKEAFRAFMRNQARFAGVRIFTHALMSNHFHILIHVPPPAPIDDRELRCRLQAIYRRKRVVEIMERIEGFRGEGRADLAEAERELYLRRMHDLGAFMKELKQRFSQWYNRRSQRRGTLWEERYKSVLVEGSPQALLTVAAYIDLNGYRAGLGDPGGYRWCGYGEALAGTTEAREGLQSMLELHDPAVNWNRFLATYRRLLVRQPGETLPGKARPEGKLELSTADLLGYRVRYFTDGAVLGGKQFVDAVYQQYRDRFGRSRRDGARAMKGGDWQGLCVMRDLRKDVLSPSG